MIPKISYRSACRGCQLLDGSMCTAMGAAPLLSALQRRQDLRAEKMVPVILWMVAPVENGVSTIHHPIIYRYL
jgi:hypothetical protein